MPITENSFLTARFNMVMRPEERAMLQAVAADARLRESELVRKWIVDSYTKRFGKKNPGELKPKPNSRVAREAKAKRAKR
ncbi:MAG TPA: hypothetical protein VGI10_22745 [Polyangiaceae bacterium]